MRHFEAGQDITNVEGYLTFEKQVEQADGVLSIWERLRQSKVRLINTEWENPEERKRTLAQLEELLKVCEQHYEPFKKVCKDPRSHLKSISEVRPIDTVKRVGYESVAYLASHSEDWQARSFSGLIPSRLFARTEDIEYAIYENRFVYSFLDKLLELLRKYYNQRDKEYKTEQTIQDAHTNAYGRDPAFGKCVHILAQNIQITSTELVNSRNLVNKLKECLDKYEKLRRLKLVRLLRNSKHLLPPIEKTNILAFDKNYASIYALYQAVSALSAASETAEQEAKKQQIDSSALIKSYCEFVKYVTHFALYALDFKERGNGKFVRQQDHMTVLLRQEDAVIKLMFCSPLPETLKNLNRVQREQVKTRVGDHILSGAQKMMQVSIYTLPKIINSAAVRAFKEFVNGQPQSDARGMYVLACEKLKDLAPVYLAQQIYHREPLEPETNDREKWKQKEKKEPDQRCQWPAYIPLSLGDLDSYRRVQKLILSCLAKLSYEAYLCGTEKERQLLCPFCGSHMEQGKDNWWTCSKDNTKGKENEAAGKCLLKAQITSCGTCRGQFMLLRLDNGRNVKTTKKAYEDLTRSILRQDAQFDYRDVVGLNAEEHPICPYCGNDH